MSRSLVAQNPPLTTACRRSAWLVVAALAGCSFDRPPDLPEPDGGGGGDGGDGAAPAVVSSTPAPHAAGVDPAATVRVVFSKPLDPAAPAQFVVTAAGVTIEGTASIDGANLVFRPSAALPSGTPLDVTVAGVADLAGHVLAAPYVFDFTTKTTLCVNTAGSNGCSALPSQAVAAAASGDSIAIAAGTYVDNVAIDKTVHLLGGFDDSFATRDPQAQVTTLRPLAPPSAMVPIIDITGGASLIDGVTLTGGNSNEHGGGLRISGGTPRIQHSVISANTAFFTGGGIYIHGTAVVELVGNTIDNNTVGGQDNCSGAGVTIENTPVTFRDNTITNNRVLGNMGLGGGVFITTDPGVAIEFTNNHIEQNHTGDIGTTGAGGGLWVSGATVTITGGTLSRNDVGNTTGAGGGLYVSTGQVRVDGVDIEGNSAGIQTGAGASGIDATDSQLVVTSSLIAGNHGGTAGISAGVSSSGHGAAALINCTIASNDTRGVTAATLLTVVNTAIVKEPVGINLSLPPSPAPAPAVVISHNALFGCTTNASGLVLDASNLTVDPKFDSNFRLTAGSPLIDAGLVGAIQTADGGAAPITPPSFDLDGGPRSVGAGPDIGADEYRP